MIKTFNRYFLRALAFLLALFLMSKLFPSYFGMIDVYASSNRTMTPNQMSFQTGSSSPVVVPVSSFTYSSYPYMTFYGYTSISDNLWNYAGWTFWSRQTGNFDLSFMYIGAWNTNSNDALSFSITQGSTVYPCTNTPISVKNGSANRAIISVFCPNVSLTANDFTINMEVPSSKLLTGSSIGITPLNLYEQGTTTLQNEVSKATEQIKETNDTIKDTDTTGASSSGNSFFNDFDEGSEGDLTDLVSLPLNFINHLNDKCQPFTLPMGNIGNVSIPCLSSLWSSSSFANIINIAKIILNGLICYKVGLNLLIFFKDLKDPDKDKLEVMDL